MAAKKRRAASLRPGKYKGLYVHVTRRSAKTKAGKRIELGQVLLAVGDPGDDGWVPVLARGVLDHVQSADVRRIVSEKVEKPTAAQQAARKRLVKKSGVKVSAKEADKIRAQWGR